MALRVGILTSIDRGVASHHLDYLMRHPSDAFEIVCAIQVTKAAPLSTAFWKRKAKKIARIGVLGALNGMRIRSWFDKDVADILRIAPLQETCTQRGVQLHQVEQLNSEEMKGLLRRLGCDVVISLGNGFIAPSVFNIPREGMLNIHHELLPEFRNAQSVIWQLYQGSSNTDTPFIELLVKSMVVNPSPTNPSYRVERLWHDSFPHHCGCMEASAVGLHKFLKEGMQGTNLQICGTPSQYTTPTLFQFARIWRNWKNSTQRPQAF